MVCPKCVACICCEIIYICIGIFLLFILFYYKWYIWKMWWRLPLTFFISLFLSVNLCVPSPPLFLSSAAAFSEYHSEPVFMCVCLNRLKVVSMIFYKFRWHNSHFTFFLLVIVEIFFFTPHKKTFWWFLISLFFCAWEASLGPIWSHSFFIYTKESNLYSTLKLIRDESIRSIFWKCNGFSMGAVQHCLVPHETKDCII